VTNLRRIKKEVRMGKSIAQAEWRGDLEVLVHQKDGETKPGSMKDVLVVPELGYNLFSITKVIESNNFQLYGDKNGYKIRKGDYAITFDRRIGTGSSKIRGVKMLRKTTNEETATPALEKGVRVPYKDFHERVGHASSEVTKATATYLEVLLTGKAEKCDNCAIAKARQKNMVKKTVDKSKTPGKRLLIDISSVKSESRGGSKFWLLVEDEATNFNWSRFLKKKSDLAQEMIKLVKEINIKKKVKYIRCDNAGEHRTFESEAIDEQLGLTFEYTAPGTPQQNGLAFHIWKDAIYVEQGRLYACKTRRIVG
jgi:hypothetical protein